MKEIMHIGIYLNVIYICIYIVREIVRVRECVRERERVIHSVTHIDDHLFNRQREEIGERPGAVLNIHFQNTYTKPTCMSINTQTHRH